MANHLQGRIKKQQGGLSGLAVAARMSQCLDGRELVATRAYESKINSWDKNKNKAEQNSTEKLIDKEERNQAHF